MAPTINALGQYRGFSLGVSRNAAGFQFHLNNPSTKLEHRSAQIGDPTGLGAVQRIDNVVTAIKKKAEETDSKLKQNRASLITFQGQAVKPFAEGDRLERLQADLVDIERRLQGQEKDSKREAAAGKFFIATTEGFKEASPNAESVSFEGFRNFDFFIEETGREFQVREAASGKLIDSGASKRQAIDAAQSRLESVGLDRFRRLQQEGERAPHRTRELVGV